MIGNVSGDPKPQAAIPPVTRTVAGSTTTELTVLLVDYSVRLARSVFQCPGFGCHQQRSSAEVVRGVQTWMPSSLIGRPTTCTKL